LEALAVLLSLIGLAGTVLPALPGALLIFATAFGYAWLTGFERIGAPVLWTLGALAAAAQVADLALSAVATRVAGASRAAAAGALIGAVLGVVVLGPIGLVAGPFLGAFAAELLSGRDVAQS